MKSSRNEEYRKVSLSKLVVLCFYLTLAVLCFLNRDQLTVEAIVNFTPEEPVWAAAVMLCFFVIKGCTVMTNGNILYAASGVMFSLPAALLVNTAGTLIMTTLPYLIGRKGGEKSLESLVQKYKKLEPLKNAPRHGEMLFTFILRILGVLPCEPVGMYLGACGVRYSRYICGTVLGLLPAIAAYAVIGEYVSQPSSPQFIAAICFQLLTMLCGVVGSCLWKRRGGK